MAKQPPHPSSVVQHLALIAHASQESVPFTRERS